MKSGITDNCPCGATDVPVKMAFGLYVHQTPTGARCAGESPDDHFKRQLRNSGLALSNWGYRLMTDGEIAYEDAEQLADRRE